jgi:hypothetical protein
MPARRPFTNKIPNMRYWRTKDEDDIDRKNRYNDLPTRPPPPSPALSPIIPTIPNSLGGARLRDGSPPTPFMFDPPGLFGTQRQLPPVDSDKPSSSSLFPTARRTWQRDSSSRSLQRDCSPRPPFVFGESGSKTQSKSKRAVDVGLLDSDDDNGDDQVRKEEEDDDPLLSLAIRVLREESRKKEAIEARGLPPGVEHWWQARHLAE